MVAYNFQWHFCSKVEDGLKRQTVRAPRKRASRVGDTLQLYGGLRTSRCRKLRDVVCTQVTPLTIGDGWIERDGVVWEYAAIREFAWRDGFMHAEQMFEFFEKTYRLPAQMEVLTWDVETLDAVTYGGINVTYHIGDTFFGTPFVRDLVAAGMTLWRTPSGCLVSTLPWEWDGWVERVRVLPWYLFDGIPATWTRYEL